MSVRPLVRFAAACDACERDLQDLDYADTYLWETPAAALEEWESFDEYHDRDSGELICHECLASVVGVLP